MVRKILLAFFIALMMVQSSCNKSGNNIDKPVEPADSTNKSSIIDEEFSPDIVCQTNNGITTLIENNYGLSFNFPSEFNQVMETHWGGEDVYFSVGFNFSQPPYNGELTEECASYIHIKIKKNYPYVPDEDERPRRILKAYDGSDLFIIDKYQTSSVIGFGFANADIPYDGFLELEPEFFDKYEAEIFDMLKSITKIKTN